MNVSQSTAFIGVMNDAKYEEEEVDPREYPERCLLLFGTNAPVGPYHVIKFKEPHITKYLTILVLFLTTARVHLIINYTLKKASKADLVWEFVKKSKT